MSEQRTALLEYKRIYNLLYPFCKDEKSTNECVIVAVIEIKNNCHDCDLEYWDIVMMQAKSGVEQRKQNT